MTHSVASRPVRGGEMWARSALSTLTRVPGVHRAGLAVGEGGGRRLLFTANDRHCDDFVHWCEIDPNEDVPLTHTARTGQPIVGSRKDLAAAYPAFIDRQSEATAALACAPIVAAGQVLGGYVLYFDAVQPFDTAQHHQLRKLGTQLGDALRQVQRATRHANRSLRSEPVPQGAQCATYSVAPHARAVADARHLTATILAGWGVSDATVDAALLCLNELVTNAVMHTRDGCEVRVLLDDDVLTTWVRDNGSTVLVDPRHVTTDPLAVHGRGLQLVAATATRWGSELDAGGMTVWFILDGVAGRTSR